MMKQFSMLVAIIFVGFWSMVVLTILIHHGLEKIGFLEFLL